MKQGRVEKIVMKPERMRGLRVWDVITAALAFGGIFLAIVSATEGGVAHYLAVLLGIALIAVHVSLGNRKLVRILTPVFCGVWSIVAVLVNIGGFAGSAVGFLNRTVAISNANMHYGFPSIRSDLPSNGITDFFFASVISVWLAYFTVFASAKGSVMTPVAFVFFSVLMIFGLFPAPYTIVILFFGLLGKYIAGYGTDAHTTMSLVISIVLVVCISSAGLFYRGSDYVRNLKSSIGASAEKILFGKDGLPQGKLKNAIDMNGEGERLEVSVNGITPTFYLKGFVGAELNGNEWKETDKNVYVSSKYQGIIEYLAEKGIPDTQYAEYLTLGGNNGRYELTVKNKNANAKYAYTPYSIAEYPSGFSVNYDLGLRRDLFSPSSYTVKVISADASSEGVVQAGWLTGGQSQTAEMREYITYEGNYRTFVYDNYCAVPDDLQDALLNRLGDAGSYPTVNSVTRLIRTWLEANYRYSAVPDAFEGDFMEAFLGREILTANPAYFASVGVYAFRAYGFAARYAEGYLVRGGESQQTLTVTGENGHAWVEVYFDGIGWLPIEITPTIYTLLDPDRPPPEPEGPGGDEDPDNPPYNPDDPDHPDQPDRPDHPDLPEDSEKPLPDGAEKTLPVLRALIPVLSCILVLAVAALAIILRRECKLSKKRKRLRGNGETYGRTAYDILCGECKPIGGFNEQELANRGVKLKDTQRFIQIVERTVYGGYELTQNEQRAVEAYLSKVSKAITASGNKAFALRCKYWYCLGL